MKKLTISLLAVIVAVFMAVPAMADVTPYASLRLGTFWQTDDTAADSDSDLQMPFGNWSRFGAKFKTGDITGHVEFGLMGGIGAYHRLLYGKWDFGGGTLLVGQDYSPYTLISSQIAPRVSTLSDGNAMGTYATLNLESYFIGYGALWDSRNPQIRLNLDNGLYAAIIAPSAAVPDGLGAGADTDVTMPKICVGYKIKGEGLMLNPGIVYNSINYDDGTFDGSVDSYIVYLGGKVALGPADLKFNVHMGQNVANLGLWNREEAAQAIVSGSTIEDASCMGVYVQASFKVDPATITVGYGQTQSENDGYGTGEADTQSSYFVNAKIPIAKTFFVVPEFSYYDAGEDATGASENKEATYMGVMWQMNF